MPSIVFILYYINLKKLNLIEVLMWFTFGYDYQVLS